MRLFQRSYQRVLVLGLIVGCACLGPEVAWAKKDKAKQGGGSAIRFSSDLDGTLAAARESGKPVMLSFHAVWCPNCRRMAEFTIPAPEVQALADRYLWVSIDIDRNITIAREWNVYGTPFVYLLDPQGRRRRQIVGAREPAEFAALLTDFLDELQREEAIVELVVVEEGAPTTELSWTPKGYRGLAICFSHVGYGPLSLQSQGPFQSLRLGLIPRTPSTLANGQVDLKVAGTWANVWAIDNDGFGGVIADVGEYLLDYETLYASVRAAYGFTDHLQLELEYDHRRRFGGEMDGFIQGFHDTFSIDQAGRKDVPKGDFTFVLNPTDGQPSVSLSRSDRGTFSRNLLFTVQHNVTCGTAKYPAFSYAATGRWSLESDDLTGDDFDYGVSVATSRRFKNFYGYLTLGYAWFGSDDFRGIELRDAQFSSLAVVEWRWKPRMSWLAQLLVTEGVAARGFDPFSDPAFEITLGWKREIVTQGVLEIGLIENVVTFDNSADFGAHVGYAQRF